MEKLQLLQGFILFTGAIGLFAISIYARELYKAPVRDYRGISFLIFLITIIVFAMLRVATPLIN